MANAHFRAGVVAVVTNSAGQLLVFERADVPGAWQLPQGGVDIGEDPRGTVWRELREETGLDERHVDLVDEYPAWVAYEFPPEIRNGKRLGQAQRWFTFRAKDDEITPVPDEVEFVAWRWVDRDWLIDHVVDFRRQSYRTVLGAPVAQSET